MILPRIFDVDKDMLGVYLSELLAPIRIRVNVDPEGNVENCYVHCDWMISAIRVDLKHELESALWLEEYRAKERAEEEVYFYGMVD